MKALENGIFLLFTGPYNIQQLKIRGKELGSMTLSPALRLCTWLSV